MEMVAECDRSIFGGDQGQGPGVLQESSLIARC